MFRLIIRHSNSVGVWKFSIYIKISVQLAALVMSLYNTEQLKTYTYTYVLIYNLKCFYITEVRIRFEPQLHLMYTIFW